jgi:polysaccharide biosynthesis transport protein
VNSVTTLKQKEIHLFDYVLVLRRRRWIVLSTFLLAAIAVTVGAMKKPEPVPVFQAATTLVVQPDRPALVTMQGGQPFYQQYFDEGVDQRTQLQILTSRVILERLIDELALVDGLDAQHSKEYWIEKFRQSIRVEQVPGTYLVRIVAYDNVKDQAIRLANTMAEVYIEYNLQIKLSSARRTLVWLNEQIVDLRTKVQDAYDALSTYQNQNQLLSLEMSPELQAQKLAELNFAYEQTRDARIEAEARLNEFRRWRQQQGGDIRMEVTISMQDPVIEKLRSDLMDAQIERANLLQSYKELHPSVVQIDGRIETLRQNLNKALDTVFQKFEADISVARAREQGAAQSLAKFKQEAIEINNKRLEYSKLKSEVSSTEELYNLLFKQLRETSITGDLERNNIRILEPAQSARNITEPLQREQIIGFGIIIGLVLGVGLAFIVEYFDKTVKNPEDVELYIGLPVLGTIPKIDYPTGKGPRKIAAPSKHYALEGEQ